MRNSKVQSTTHSGNYSCHPKYIIQPPGESIHYLSKSILGSLRLRHTKNKAIHDQHQQHKIPLPILRKLPEPNLFTLHKRLLLESRGKLPLQPLHIRLTRPTNPPIRNLRTLRNTHNNPHKRTITILARILPDNRRLFPSLLRPLTKLRRGEAGVSAARCSRDELAE